MERDFDSVSVLKDKDTEGVLKLSLKEIKSSHTANAKHNAGTLKVTADLNGKLYGYEMNDVDIQDAIKCQVKNGSVEVTVKKNSNFKLQDKI